MREDATISIDDFARHDGVKFVRHGGEQGLMHYVRQRVVGVSPWALSAPAAVAALAAHAGPMLVEGEPGAGKEFIARLVHDCGPRAHRPFVVVRADALDESVLQAVLFEAPESLPAPTREIQREVAERARGGTLYVCDVAALSPGLARRIVRAVHHPELEHARKRSLQGKNIRIVFGANDAVAPEDGRGPRSGVVRIPPLRARGGDVELLADLFAVHACHRLGKEPRVLAPAAVERLRTHAWPGNVGELKRVVEAMVRRSGPPTLEASLLPAHLVACASEPGTPLGSAINLHDEVQRYEISLLTAALERCGGVQTKAANLLGLKVSTLNSKLANYNIDASAFKVRRTA